MLVWPNCFLEAWGAHAKQNTHVSRTNRFFSLAAEGGKANKPLASRRCVVVGLGSPGQLLKIRGFRPFCSGHPEGGQPVPHPGFENHQFLIAFRRYLGGPGRPFPADLGGSGGPGRN